MAKMIKNRLPAKPWPFPDMTGTTPRKLYEVKLIHKTHDWDAGFTYEAPDAKTARKWAMTKLAVPADWLIISAKTVKPATVVKVG